MARSFPKTAQIETVTEGMRLCDEEFDVIIVGQVSVRGFASLRREDGRSMGAGGWVSVGFIKLRYKQIVG
jgi:hypothetical protein